MEKWDSRTKEEICKIWKIKSKGLLLKDQELSFSTILGARRQQDNIWSVKDKDFWT